MSTVLGLTPAVYVAAAVLVGYCLYSLAVVLVGSLIKRLRQK